MGLAHEGRGDEGGGSTPGQTVAVQDVGTRHRPVPDVPEHVGLVLPFHGVPATQAVRAAVLAERLGYASVWAPETDSYDAVGVLGAAAMVTKRVELGTGVLPVGTRSPALLAMAAATVGALAPGRVVLGLGVSSPGIIEGWHGQPYGRPVARLRETVMAIRSNLLGGQAADRGTAPVAPGFRLGYRPAPCPRIYVAALGPAMRAAAREVADGIILNFAPRRTLKEFAARIRAQRGEFPVTAYVRVATQIGGDAEWRVRREIASYLRLRSYREWLKEMDYADAVDHLVGGGDLDAMARRLPDELVADVSVFGDPATCARALRAMVGDGVTPLVVPAVSPLDEEAFEATARAVAPGGDRRAEARS